MAIDTEDKRRSVQGYTQTVICPVADGTIAAADREHETWLYRGIAADAPGGVTIMAMTRQTHRRVMSRVFSRVN